MPIAVQFDQPVDDAIARARMYGGAINVTPPSTTAVAFIRFARELIGEAFGGRDPELAEMDLPAAEHAAILDGLGRRFDHHPECRRFVHQLLAERGCNPETTYVDVPRLRASTGEDYLPTGIARTSRPHRDTWRAAPLAQLNHWVPVYDVTEDNAIALHSAYFDQAIANDSSDYDHDRWDAGSRPLPVATKTVDPFSAGVFVVPTGGVLQFSGHHLRSEVPSDTGRTRFTIDFRTIDVDDVRAGLGARNVDGRCTGSSIRDFVSAADLSAIPDDVVIACAGAAVGRDASARPTRPAFEALDH